MISENSTIIGPGPVELKNTSENQAPLGIGENHNVKLINPHSSEEEVLIAHKIEAENEEVIDNDQVLKALADLRSL